MTRGVYYYFIKPPDYRKLKSILARAVEQRKLKRELELLKKRLSEENGKHLIVGKTAKTLSILNAIQAVKDSPSSVLISGETGTGKELVARALHYSSARREKPFVAVNCAAIPKELLEAELFGYERGAFTGAISRRVGKFEEAADGTVFLDEIGELELPMQAKLLRVLQEREIERLGSSRKIKADFRLISSTNRDLKREVRAKNFRQDLFYRINVVEIQVPPLREKKDDIPLLCAEFIKEFSIRENKIFTLSDETMQIFRDYDWPGNIRQLRNIVERAVALSKGNKITPQELPDELASLRSKTGSNSSPKTLREIEIQAIQDVLERCGKNKSEAARVLGISRKALYKRLKDFSIS